MNGFGKFLQGHLAWLFVWKPDFVALAAVAVFETEGVGAENFSADKLLDVPDADFTATADNDPSSMAFAWMYEEPINALAQARPANAECS